MEWARRWARRLGVVLARDAFERRMDDEMRHHIECETAERVRQGMTPEAARAAALGAFGRVERFKEEARAARGLRLLESALVDARYALRVLRRGTLFTATTVLTFALGVGAATAIFSVVYGVLLRPLPYPAPDRLVALWSRDLTRPADHNVVSTDDFEAWRARTRGFASMAAMVPKPVTLAGDGGGAEHVVGADVSPSYFRVLGVAPALGRALAGRDEIVLGDALWRRRFGADRGVIGRALVIEGHPYTVVGVMPPAFDPPRFAWLGEQAFWTSFAAGPETKSWGRFLLVIARLEPGVTVARAASELEAVGAQLARESPGDRGWSTAVVPLAEQITGDVRAALVVLLGTVGLLAVMAVTNVATLTLARTRGRRHELAVRRALGATRWRVARQLLTQSVLLGALGAAAGLAVAAGGVRLLTALLPSDVPRATSIRVDGPVLLFGLAAAAAATLVFGCLGAFRGASEEGAGAMAPALRERLAMRRSRHGGALVAGEVALGLVLAVLAALMLRSFVALRRVELGFTAERVVAARVALSGDRYGTPERQRAFFDALTERLRAAPGVRAVGVTSRRPLGGMGPASTVTDAARPLPPGVAAPTADVRLADRGYFATLRVPMIDGSPFDARERPDGPARVVIDQTLARTLWPSRRAVGQHAAIPMYGGLDAEVVGVVGDVRLMEPRAASRGVVYLAADRYPDVVRDVVVRGDGDPAAIEATTRASVAALDPTVPLYEVRPLGGLVADATARDRFTTALLGAFAALALLLAGVGIFGVLSTDVADRRAEIGVRLALGARRSGVLLLVVRRALARAAAGVALGTAAALGIARFLGALLFGVGAADPLSFVGVAAVLLGVATAAALLPALHAARIAPVTAMRGGGE